MVKVFTIQMSSVRKAVSLGMIKKEDVLDITVKSGDKTSYTYIRDGKVTSIFAPSWDIVMAHKNKKITNDQYRIVYYHLMRGSYKLNTEMWLDILNNKEYIVFACFCGANDFCHRFELANIYVKLGAEYKGEIRV